MSAKLFCKTGQLTGAEFEIHNETTIGKRSENNIVLYPNTISGKHARIYFDFDKESYFIEDLSSRNGTRVDGIRVRGKERLDKLNVITFARAFDFIFQTVADELSTQQGNKTSETIVDSNLVIPDVFSRTPAVEDPSQYIDAEHPKKIIDKTIIDSPTAIPPLISKTSEKSEKSPDLMNTIGDASFAVPPISIADKTKDNNDAGQTIIEQTVPKKEFYFVLTIVNSDGKELIYKLKEGENIVGRSKSCEVTIDDSSMSRKHSILMVKADKVTIRDLGSKNSTFVGKQRVTSQEVELSPDAELKFGLIEAKLVMKK